MRLTSIELHNFLSHASTRLEPNGAKLLSIVGANGAGKSSLLDGVLYSLYDAARAKTDQLVRLGQTDMSAAVTFEFDGATYRVVRGRTTKSGGKTYLELAVKDGEAWRPLTGDDIRSTQAAIEQLLGLDATSFTSSTFLRQGEADAFTAATPSERKRVLSQTLGLDVYAAAEARARDLARELDARTAADRAQAERLEDEVAMGREGIEAELEQGREQLVDVEASLATANTKRDAIDARIRGLEADIAAGKAIADQVAGLEREKAAAGEAWHRARDRHAAAAAEIGRLEQVLAGSAEVTAAAAALPDAKAAVEALVAGESEDRRIADMDRAIRDLEIPHSHAVATWTAQHTAAAAKVAELEAHAKAGAAVCEACGQPITRDTAIVQLTAARAAVKALGEKPVESIAIARARAQRVRLEERHRELAFDPAAMTVARERLASLERVAARGETIAAARASIDREGAAIADAETEQIRIGERGKALAGEIEALAPKLAGRPALEAAWASARNDGVAIANEITTLDGSRRLLERAIATGEARLEALEKSAAAAAGIRERLAVDETEAGRLRRLVQAFGVTGIPAKIIAGVLPELAAYANELLGELRPGMTLELRAQRAKRSGDGVVEALDLVVRDAAGERPLALFSGGERMSVSLALAVGLSRLVARRAGARISSLVVDEPDGLDSEARRSFGIALRTIAHRGELERVILVSHHADLAEFADETYQVTKGPNGSVVELVS